MIRLPFLTCLLLCACWCSVAVSQTQIKYHKTTGFDKDFPFDEPFQIKLEGFDADTPYTQYRMVFRHLDRKKDLNKYKSDTELYRSLDSFTVDFTANGIGVYPRFMKPNEYYIVDISQPQIVQASEHEKKRVISQLQDNISFQNEIMQLLENTPSQNFKESDLGTLIEAELNTMGYIILDQPDTKSSQALSDSLKLDIGRISNRTHTLIKKWNNLTTTIDSAYSNTINPYKSFVDSLSKHTFTESDNLNPIGIKYSELDSVIQLLNSTLQVEEMTNIDLDAKQDVQYNLEVINETMEALRLTLRKLPENYTKLYIEKNNIGRVLGSSKVNEDLVEGNTNRAHASISQTFGWGFSPRTSNGYLYVGYTLFFRPVNYSVPLRNIGTIWNIRDLGEIIKATVGINLGFTLSDIETNGYSEASGIVKFLGNKGLIVGLGIRPYHFIKLDINGLMYNISDPNPLVTHKKVAFTPMIGLSLNINLIKLFQGDPNSFTTLFKP